MFAEIIEDLVSAATSPPLFREAVAATGFTPLPNEPRDAVEAVASVRPRPSDDVWVDLDGTAHEPLPTLFPLVMACNEQAPRDASIVRAACAVYDRVCHGCFGGAA